MIVDIARGPKQQGFAWSRSGELHRKPAMIEEVRFAPDSPAERNGSKFQFRDASRRGTTLTIKTAISKVEGLIKNEERVIGVHTYRILMGTYVSSWTPAFLNFCRADNTCASAKKGKFIVLVKLNDFTGRWTLVAWDVTDFNHEFTTRNVDQQLLSLR